MKTLKDLKAVRVYTQVKNEFESIGLTIPQVQQEVKISKRMTNALGNCKIATKRGLLLYIVITLSDFLDEQDYHKIMVHEFAHAICWADNCVHNGRWVEVMRAYNKAFNTNYDIGGKENNPTFVKNLAASGKSSKIYVACKHCGATATVSKNHQILVDPAPYNCKNCGGKGTFERL